MVFQRKSGGRAKQQTPAKSKKSFTKENDLDDMDMDFNDSNDNQVTKKTPGKSPKGKQIQNDKRVSFQIPGKNTPNKGTPKGALVGKKQATPAKVGSLKAFGGMAANSASKSNGKAKKAASDSDDDDDDEDDDDDDDADLDMMLAGGDSEDDDDDDDDDDDEEEEDEDDEADDKAIKSKKNVKTNALTPGKKAAKDDDEDDEDDDDDDDAEDDDDDDDEDDEEEEEVEPKNKQNAKQQNQSKNAQKKNSTPDQNKNAKQMEKSPIKKEAISPKKTEQKNMNPIVENFVKLDTQRRRERDSRTLYIGNLPRDIVATELKALSTDILAVNVPNHQKNKRSCFAFLEFANEAKAEENFKLLKNKKLRGEPLTIDYAGEKSLHRKQTELPNKDLNLKKLYIADIPVDGMMDEVAKYFPKSIQISLAVRPTFKSATIQFATDEDAAEALEAAKSAKIGSKLVTVVYSIQRDVTTKKKRKRPSKGKQNQAGAKKMKLDTKEGSDDDDDDDDDEEE